MTDELPLDFRILGPLRVIGPDGDVPLGGPNERAVLAFLLRNAGQVVTTEAIADAVWNNRPKQAHRSATQTHISRLRRKIGSSPTLRITSFADGRYLLTVPDGCLDWARFQQARADGVRARSDGRADLAAAAFRVALAEWAGPALADLAGLFFADAFAVAAEEDRLGTLESRIDAEVALGMGRELIGELTGLVAAHPSHEGFWLQLMRALFEAGRPADAIEVYRRMWTTWPEVTGLDVSDAARCLADAIRANDGLAVRGVREGRALRRRTVADHRHPIPPASLRFPDGSRIAIPAGGLRIGRDPASDLVFTAETVSWNHAAISVGVDGYTVDDLHSTNHTWIDGAAIAAGTLLATGTAIRIGDTTMIFEADGETGR